MLGLTPRPSTYFNKDKTKKHSKQNPKSFHLIKLEHVPKELLIIAENVAAISGTWNPVEIYTPDASSRQQEQEKVFKAFENNDSYNPIFSYSYSNSLDLSKSKESLFNELDRLKKLKVDDLSRTAGIFKIALTKKVRDDLATCELVEGINHQKEQAIKSALRKKYSGLDQSLYDLAVEEYIKLTHQVGPENQKKASKGTELSQEEYNWLRSKEISPEEQVEAFKWALSQYGILRTAETGKGYQVVSSNQTTAIDVRDKSAIGPTVFVPKKRPVKPLNAEALLLLIAHEIEGHARQSMNGEELFYLGGGRLKIDNEELYEGLGLRYELSLRKKLFRQEDVAPKPFYVFAVKMAEEGVSFFDIFKDQVERHARTKFKLPNGNALPRFTDIEPQSWDQVKKSAWNITYRTMRGHTDMTNKYSFAMPKDLSYLRGYQMDQQLVANGFGHLNEEGVMASGALSLLAEISINEKDLPYPFRDVASKYWEEVLKPQMKEK